MEEAGSAIELVQRYRRDRRALLSFILSANLVKKVVLPPGAVSLDDVNLDEVSVDYVLACSKKGDILELSEAIRDYHDALIFPPRNNAGFIEEFFLVTNPEESGLAPMRPPPPIPLSQQTPITTSLSKSQSLHSAQYQELSAEDIDDFDDEDEEEEVQSLRTSRRLPDSAADLVLKLPPFATGITDDDLRETAYEILLASAGASGGLIVPTREKKKDRKSRIMRKLARSKSDNVVTQPQHPSGLTGLLETMRVQLEISEGMDVRTRQGLLHALVGKEGKRMDALLIPLELMCCISRSEFSDLKAYLRWQKRQLNMLEEGLLNHPVVGFGESRRKESDLRSLLKRIEESESLPASSGQIQRSECLRSLREIATSLAERPARGDLTGEVCHWADGYHLNVRLYEKLLSSVFDVLDEGKLAEEVEEILELLKSTWRILDITETIHYTCYAWVLFRQFVVTGEQRVLQHSIEQLRKIPLKEQLGPQERLHLKNLRCSIEGEEGSQGFAFMESFLLPIQKWVDRQLGDYHLHFAERFLMMEGIVTVGILTRRLVLEEPGLALQMAVVSDREQIESYVSSSIKHAFARTFQEVEDAADLEDQHMLATLADECKELLKRETTKFMPVLTQWNPQATVFSASILHRLYGIKLKPLLDRAEHLTEDAVSVLSAADCFEKYVLEVITSSEVETIDGHRKDRLIPYKIETISGNLVLRWVNSQLTRISEWVERSIQQESWDPISPQQRHGSSIVEIYRIIEETVDQFFSLKVPMRPGELTALFRGLDSAFTVYTHRVVEKLVNKEDLMPHVPILTRYKRESGIKAFVKKEVPDIRMPNDRRSSEVNGLSTASLCVRLNTLHYAISHLGTLEDSIWNRWMKIRAPENSNMKRAMNERSQSFGSTPRKDGFEGSRKEMNAAIDKISEFTGTKIIFWDLREQFIDDLYKPNVSQSRFEILVDVLDMELSRLCDVIVMPLRDRVVTGLLQASLDGLQRVLLDGGPSRIFSPSDSKLLEEDLESLKEFFISGGQGLPRGTVENLVSRVRPIIKLHGYETRALIDDIKSSSIMGSRSKLGDPQMVIRILCHRSDSEASQFLKKQYKLPKSAA